MFSGFLEKKYYFMHFEILPFKMQKIIFFPEEKFI